MNYDEFYDDIHDPPEIEDYEDQYQYPLEEDLVIIELALESVERLYLDEDDKVVGFTEANIDLDNL